MLDIKTLLVYSIIQHTRPVQYRSVMPVMETLLRINRVIIRVGDSEKASN